MHVIERVEVVMGNKYLITAAWDGKTISEVAEIWAATSPLSIALDESMVFVNGKLVDNDLLSSTIVREGQVILILRLVVGG